MKTDYLIIGGGLAGLFLALQLEQKGLNYQLIEARNRLGGRIDAHTILFNEIETNFDIGPSWFWPGQVRIARLVKELGLEFFEQYSHGAIMFEDETGKTQRDHGYASMQGSYRLVGSLKQLITSLAGRIPSARYKLNCRAVTIEQVTQSIRVHTLSNRTNNNDEEIIECKKLVLALPPRIAAQTITYSPSLDTEILSTMQQIPTWMAGHAKALAIYKQPFWREAGLSGDAMSRYGPLVEIHDASPKQQGPYALFGFMGIPACARARKLQELTNITIAQLVRLFGEQASTPLDIIIKDWAFESETATALDHSPLTHHPVYGLPNSLKDIWSNRIILGSTEAAPHYGGYIEGALEAAELTLAALIE